jgi:predicted TIM-barrel fold metal-dependent hydrolase
MAGFDVDAHVEESVDTWKYLDAEFQIRRPTVVTAEDSPRLFGRNAFWLIDGNLFPHPSGRGITNHGTPTSSISARRKAYSVGSQELTDVEARLRDMDRFGIDTQVINPTLLTSYLSPDAPLEYALARAYNTWIAEVCQRSGGRLRWNGVVRLTDADAAVGELRRIAGMGAEAAWILGLAHDQTLDSRRLDPFWAVAEQLGMPVYVHIGFPSPAFMGLFERLYMSVAFANRASLLMGFVAIVGTGVAERFPRLRFVFAEAGVEWVPWLVHVMDGYWRLGKHVFQNAPRFGHSETQPSEIIRQGNIYVICEADEDLRGALEVLGEDRIVLGSDMPHSEARPTAFREFGARDDLSDRAKAKIMAENAQRFYAR